MSEDVETPIEELKAMAHPLRFRILQALGPGERNVGEIEAETNIGQPTLSQQLAVLRKAGLVSTRKEAKLVYYRVAAERLAEIAEVISAFAESDREPSSPAVRTPTPGVANFARLASNG